LTLVIGFLAGSRLVCCPATLNPDTIPISIMPITINGERIEDSVLREEERLIRPRLMEEMPEEDPFALQARVKEWARENVVERTVLRQEALRDPEPVPQERIEELFEQVRTQSPGESGCVAPVPDDELRRELEIRYRIERLLANVTAKVAPPKSKDISEFYKKHRDDFKREETLHAAHIVKNVDENCDEETARKAIEEAEKELQGGAASFEELADRLSDCPGRGGDLGVFPRGEMVEEFEEVIFSMQPGQVSPIFRSPFGFHIAKLYERNPEGIRDLAEVKDAIAARLAEQKRERAVEQFLDKLMAHAKIEEGAAV